MPNNTTKHVSMHRVYISISGYEGSDTMSSSENSQTVMIYALLVIFMMMGVGAMGLLSIVIDNGEKEFMQSHVYEVGSGTYMGSDAGGTGKSEYINESQRDYMYHFVTDLGKGTEAFDVICGEDKVPVGAIYTKGATETVDGKECTWWSYRPGQTEVRFAIDGSMVVHEYVVAATDGSWSFTAALNDS